MVNWRLNNSEKPMALLKVVELSEGLGTRFPASLALRTNHNAPLERCQSTSQSTTGCSRFLTVIGSRGFSLYRLRAACAVASLTRISPPIAFDSRRDAVFTVSPIAVYSERRSEPM